MSAWRRQYWSLKLLSLVGLTLIIFAIPHAMTEPPLTLYAGWPTGVTQEQRYIESYGLDRPLTVQYARWLRRLVSGDWGQSRFYNRAVLSDCIRAMNNTLVLLLWTALSTSAWLVLCRGFDRFRSSPQQPPRHGGLPLVLAIPGFMLTLLLRDLLIWKLEWLGINHMPAFDPYYLLNPAYMLLPASVMTIAPCGVWRASPAHRRWEDFCFNLRPLLSMMLLDLFLIERVLRFPGLGNLGFAALKRQDIPMLQGFLLCAGGLFLALHVILDWGAKERQRGLSPLDGSPLPPDRTRFAGLTYSGPRLVF